MKSTLCLSLSLLGLIWPGVFAGAACGHGQSTYATETLPPEGFSPGNGQAASQDETGLTPLIQAVQADDLQAVELQFLKRSDPNVKDAFGWTALMYALRSVSRGGSSVSMGVVLTLLEHGADVNAKDSRGRSVLMWAVLTGKADLIKRLIAKGADVNASDNRGATALSFALAKGYNKIAQQIKDAGGTGPPLTKADVPKDILPIDEAPVPLKPAYPKYPKEASAAGIQGIVHLHVLVKKDGSVGEIRVDKGLSHGLTESAIEAASRLVMRPGKNNGQAVDYWVSVQIEFSQKST